MSEIICRDFRGRETIAVNQLSKVVKFLEIQNMIKLLKFLGTLGKNPQKELVVCVPRRR